MGVLKSHNMLRSICAIALLLALARAAPFFIAPEASCGVVTALKCAAAVKPCLAQCKTGAKACIECLGGDIAPCCPCLEKLPVLKKLPITCPNATKTVSFEPALLAAANTSHYEDPKPDGCMTDEVGIQIQGISGDFCTPKCTGILKMSCPADVPAGVTAKPQCALRSTGGDKFCALICSPSTDAESLKAGDAMCGTATCKPIQGLGLCTYDD